MKARVKGTTSIIDVTFDKDALNEGYPPYKAGGGIYYYPEQLVWIDNIDSTEPDYWEKLKHQYVGMAMHSLIIKDCSIKEIVETSSEIATALVNRVKEEEK